MAPPRSSVNLSSASTAVASNLVNNDSCVLACNVAPTATPTAFNVPPLKYIHSNFTFNRILVPSCGRSAGAEASWLISLANTPRAICTVTQLTVGTPLNALAWAQCLASSNYPDAGAAGVLVLAIRRGMLLSYHGPREGHVVGRNLPSASQNPEAVTSDIDRECAKHRRHGPHAVPPFTFFRANPLGVVFKKGGSKPRLIHNLSWPRGGDSVNKHIDQFEIKLDAFGSHHVDALR